MGQREARRDGARRVRRRAADVRRYMIPAQVRHPFPVVLVHGGGGQGTDWLGTPDGRPGWFQYLVAGRLQGLRRRSSRAWTIADSPGAARRIPGAGAHAREHRGPLHAAERESCQHAERVPEESQPVARPGQRRLRRSRPADGGHGWQLRRAAGAAAGRGGAPGAPGAGGWWRRGQGGGRGAARQVRRRQPISSRRVRLNVQHLTWRQAGAELLDKIGPAIIMTHSAGGPFGLLVAEARPNLVKATIIIEGAGGSAFGFGSRWGLSTIPVTYDPPVNDPAEIKTKWVANPEPGVAGYYLQEEPARKLPNLKNTKVLIATADSSFASPGSPGAVAFLKQAGVQAEELRWGKLGMNGNGHAMMMEKNSRQVLQPLIDWMHKNVTGSNSQAPAPRRTGNDSLALKLADAGMFWVGTSNTKKMPYGTIHTAPMFVQYLRAGATAPPAAGRARARRRRPDGPLLRSRRDVGMGASLRAGGLQGLSRRSPGSRPIALSSRCARRDRSARHLRSAHARHGDLCAVRPTSSGLGRRATWAIRWSISSWLRPTQRLATPSSRRRCGSSTVLS